MWHTGTGIDAGMYCFVFVRRVSAAVCVNERVVLHSSIPPFLHCAYYSESLAHHPQPETSLFFMLANNMGAKVLHVSLRHLVSPSDFFFLHDLFWVIHTVRHASVAHEGMKADIWEMIITGHLKKEIFIYEQCSCVTWFLISFPESSH